MVSDTRPVWSAGTIVALITAVIGLLVAFGVPVTDEMKIGILAVAGVLAPFVVPYLSSPKVTPLADPKDKDGVTLVRSDTGGQTRSAEKRTEKQIQKFRNREIP